MKPFFVYGTLRQGQYNHTKIKAFVEELIPAVATGYLYPVYETSFPCMIHGDRPVHGELVYVSETAYPHVMARLDSLEGYDETNPHSMYIRKSITVHTQAGPVEAWAYFWNLDAFPYNVDWENRITSGDWAEYAPAYYEKLAVLMAERKEAKK